MAKLEIDINKLSPPERLNLIEELWTAYPRTPQTYRLPMLKRKNSTVDWMKWIKTARLAYLGKRFLREFVKASELAGRQSSSGSRRDRDPLSMV